MMRSDRLRPMRLAALMLLAGACGGDLDLDVRVEHPAELDVAHTVVTVYESTTLTCIDVAFGRVGSDELDAVKVAEETVTSAGEHSGGLTGISRTDHKVIVVRGYGLGGEWISAGCAEQDVVGEDTRIPITTIPTVIAATVLDADPNDSLRAVIATTDARGRSVADRRVGWTVYGPAGSLPMSEAGAVSSSDGVWEPTHPTCTNASGAASLHPSPPDIVGGYSVQLRAEWAVTLPAMYSRFIATFATELITPPVDATKFCAVRRKGSVRRIVCLDNGAARDLEVTVSGGVTAVVQRDSTPIGPEAMNIVAVPNGADSDVYVVSTRGLLVPLFGAPSPDNTGAPCADGSCEVDDALAVPPCGTEPGKLLLRLRATGAGQVKQMSAHGGGTKDLTTGPVLPGAEIQLDNAGCVTRAELGGGMSTQRQVVTYHVGTRNVIGELVPLATRAAYSCTASTCAINELFPGAGVAFHSGSESRMIVTSVDATGIVLAEVVMAPEPDAPNRDLFIERSRIPAAGIPDRLVVGQYDIDGDHDLFWNIAARRGTTFQVAYARTVGTEPLAALSGSQTLSVTALHSMDLTGDGVDDIVAIGRTDSALAALVVIPMGAGAPTVTVPSDSSCP